MSSFSSDRNLLVGVLGLQMSVISESQLIAAMQAWVFRKNDRIEDILLEQKVIGEDSRDFLQGVVAKFSALHHHDYEKSLSSLHHLPEIGRQLKEIEDVDLDHSATMLAQNHPDSKDGSASDETINFSAREFSASDRFRILRPHAQGGLGQISIAEDRELRREVALKEIKPAFVKNAESRARFIVEAEVTGRLEHPCIVPVYSLGATKSGAPFYVMRFIRGDSLKDAIAQLYTSNQEMGVEAFRLRVRHLVRRLVDVCNAIQYAHSRGVLHRDLKPGNIMLGKYGETLVVDWGLARIGIKHEKRIADDEVTIVPTLGDGSTETRMGSVVGSIAYMSPEQASGKLDLLGPASDVYSLGATLYCILTGHPPLDSASPDELIKKVQIGDFPGPREVNPRVPRPLEAICLKALSKDIQNRYSSADQLADELELWLAGEPVVAYPESILERSYRWVRRHRALVTTLSGIAATSVLMLSVATAVVSNRNLQLNKANQDLVNANNLALKNLADARQLALDQTRTSERILSQPELSPKDVLELRKSLTERAFLDYSRWYESNPRDRDLSSEFALAARIASNIKRTERDFEAAKSRLKISLDLQQATPAEQLSKTELDHLALTLADQAVLQSLDGKLNQAHQSLSQAMAMTLSNRETNPTETDYLRTQATIQLEQSGISVELGKLEEALTQIRACKDSCDAIAKTTEFTDIDQSLRLLSHAREMRILLEMHRPEEVVQSSESLISETRKLSTVKPQRNIRFALALMLTHSANAHIDSKGSMEAADASASEAIMICENLFASGLNVSHIATYSTALRARGIVLRRNENLKDSETVLARAKTHSERLVRAASLPDHHALLAKALFEIAMTKSAAGDTNAAQQSLQSAIESMSTACQQSPESVLLQRALSEMQSYKL
ncbi:MAG: serine/threonine-protein kinase [Pirellula sp.]